MTTPKKKRVSSPKSPSTSATTPRKAAPRKKTPTPMPARDLEREQLERVVGHALERNAEDLVVIDLRGLTSFTDYFIVCTGTSDRQVQAIASAVEEGMKHEGCRPLGMEGYDAGQWVLIDFGAIVVHVFYPEARAFYQVEKMWADAPRILFDAPTTACA